MPLWKRSKINCSTSTTASGNHPTSQYSSEQKTARSYRIHVNGLFLFVLIVPVVTIKALFPVTVCPAMRRPVIPTVLMMVSAWRPVPSRWPASTIVVAILVAAGRYTCRKQTTGEQSTDTSKKAASFHGYSFLTVIAEYFVACGQYQVNWFFKRAIGAIDTAAPLFWGSLSAVRQRIPPLPATGNGSILNDVRTDSCQTERIPVIFLTFGKKRVNWHCY